MSPLREANPWDLAQPHLQEALDEYSYKNWFSQTRFQSFDGGRLEVNVPSQFFADWLRDHYLDTICESMRKVAPEFDSIKFIPGGSSDGGAAGTENPAPRPKRATRQKVTQARQRLSGFNHRYTFDRFVVGAGNRFAYAAAKAVAESPGRAYNPLFLYGETGLGKTHLMQAVGQDIHGRTPGMTCAFVSSEEFTNQLIQSIADKSTNRFRNKYRKVDVLLIDDIHFIAGKEATQEEFFHTFNALYDMHRQIVISSDRPPKELAGIEERLVSRFESGLVTDIQPPDLETRVAILQNKARLENLTVPQEILRYIATHITTNIRELEGALITVLALSRLTDQKLGIDMVDEVLRDLVGSEKIRPVTIEQVQRAVAEHFDVRIADLRGSSRQRQVVKPRQMAMFLCKEMVPSLSLSDVGEAFGGKDHTTVIYACDKISKESHAKSSTRQLLEQLRKRIRS